MWRIVATRRTTGRSSFLIFIFSLNDIFRYQTAADCCGLSEADAGVEDHVHLEAGLVLVGQRVRAEADEAGERGLDEPARAAADVGDRLVDERDDAEVGVGLHLPREP